MRLGHRVIRRAGWPATAAVAAVFGLAPATRADVVFKSDRVTYEIGANEDTKQSIWRGVRKWGPSVGGERAIGMATGNVRWRYRFSREPGGCRLTQFRVFVDVRLKLPSWRRERTAPQHITRYWQCVKRTVTIHEEGHAEIWRRTGRRINWAVNQMKNVVVPCGEVKSRVNNLAQPIYDRGRRQQATFDREDRRRKRYKLCDRNPLTSNRRPATLPHWRDDDLNDAVRPYRYAARAPRRVVQPVTRFAPEPAPRNFAEEETRAPARRTTPVARVAPPRPPRTTETVTLGLRGADWQEQVGILAVAVIGLFGLFAVFVGRQMNGRTALSASPGSMDDEMSGAGDGAAMQAALDRALERAQNAKPADTAQRRRPSGLRSSGTARSPAKGGRASFGRRG